MHGHFRQGLLLLLRVLPLRVLCVLQLLLWRALRLLHKRMLLRLLLPLLLRRLLQLACAGAAGLQGVGRGRLESFWGHRGSVSAGVGVGRGGAWGEGRA